MYPMIARQRSRVHANRDEDRTASGEGILQANREGSPAAVKPNGQSAAVRLLEGRLDLVELKRRQPKRLLHEHMLARPERLPGVTGMGVVACRDEYRVYVSVVDH